ncbi:telomere resolvase [Chroococcidiopsis sp. CCNUC1]|uniref:telomere resolvase n=1 Tax=Chroococcidiopsis sp. CCNUC1 TaxID=2653189 RepID=UPI00202011FD|nr:telomere resolvase [Chroococcidiopsis sp. CCNUC1]URD48445.1 telomere resolvase [Chroococcidiopsis sp. CCNUC1]
MSNATRFDLSREEIIARYRQRIAKGDRTKLTKYELEQLALHFVERLKTLNSQAEIQALCEAEITLLEEGYPQATIAGNQIPLYRRSIEDAISTGALPLTDENSHVVTWTKHNTGEPGQTQEHFALYYLKYDRAIYQQIHGEGTAANNSRQDNLQPVPLQRYLDTAVELLSSNDERQLAIALAALTGRRHTEVISKGQFQPTHHPYLLHFQGQQKKQIGEGEASPAFDILTLVPAAQVLEGIERFRTLPAIQQLEGVNSKDPKMRVLNTRIDREVKHLFQDSGIVPVLAGKKTVSIHRLRGVYRAIAIHFFCPPTKHEHRFLQHYLGHVLDQQQAAPNSIATSHYFHYRLVNQQGQPLEGQGVLLDANGLPPLERDEVQLEPTQPLPQEESIAPLESVEPVPPAQSVRVEPEQIELTSNESQRAIASPNDSTKSDPTPPRQHSLLRIFKDEHDRWLAVLDALCPQCDNQQEKTAALLQWVEARLNSSTTDIAQASPAANGVTPELVEAKSASAEAAEGSQHEPTLPAMTPAVAEGTIAQVVVDQARTLSWLTGRIEALEAEIATLKQQREQASATVEQSSQLQQEIQRLKLENRQLQQAAARFEAARAALLGDRNSTPQTAPTIARSVDSAPNSGSVWHDQEQVQVQTQQQQLPNTTTPTPTQISGSAAPKPARSGGAKERAQRIFAAICEWNQQHPQDTWAMTVGLLEETFGINRKAAKEFISANQNLIEEHHAQIGVDNQRGHNRGKDAAALKAFVQQFEA